MHPDRHLTTEAQIFDPVHIGREAESLEDAEVRRQMSVDRDLNDPSNTSPGVSALNLQTCNGSISNEPDSTPAAVDAYAVQIRCHVNTSLRIVASTGSAWPGRHR